MPQKRYLPSLSLLTAFEAVARLQSVTVAAQELSLTQSTVSRLIQNLEGQLNCTLFVREKKRLIPTSSAISYGRDVARALSMIERASMTVVANPGGGTLSLAVLPVFGTRWLAPRLSGFFKQNPGVSVNLATRIKRFNFDVEQFDAVIFYGQPDWPNARHFKLFNEQLTACASPEFLKNNKIKHAQDVCQLPLLKLETRLTAWHDWFSGQGVVSPHISGMMMDQFSMMIQVAISGLGIALLPDYLARVEIGEGRLVPVLEPCVPSGGAYWLAWPAEKDVFQPLSVFRHWLKSQYSD